MKKIVIDLTPICSGGENGGAKPFVLSLVRELGLIFPNEQFIILTSSVSHEELVILDAPNVSRLCVDHFSVTTENKILHHYFFLSFFKQAWSFFKRKSGLFNAHTLENYLTRQLKKISPDLFFCPFTAPFHVLEGVPVICLVYDLQYREYPYFFSNEEQFNREQHFQNACKTASYLICISEFTRQSVLKMSTTLLSPKQVITIPICLPEKLLENKIQDIPDLLAQFNLGNENFLLYPANFWLHKNHKMLFTAFNLYCYKHPESTLKLVCTGALNENIDVLIFAVKKMGLQERVVFPGYISSNKLVGLLHSCRAVIFPSLYEGFGMPVIEAMLAKKPVLCSHVASLPEVAGEFAWYFNPRKPDEIVASIERIDRKFDEVVNKKIILGYQHALQYLGTKKMAQEYLTVFQEAMRNRDFMKSYLHGVFKDNWSSREIMITYEPSDESRVLEVTFECPQWHPKAPLKMRSNNQFYKIKAGEVLTITQTLEHKGGKLVFFIAKGLFQPARHNMGEDIRLLGCIYKNAEIISQTNRVKLCH